MAADPNWRGPVAVISGPSGAGKTTLCLELARDPRFHVAVTATTRSPRPGERNGEAYYFLTREQFAQKLAAGEFLEHAEFFGNLYGTPRASLSEPARAGKIPVLNIDVIGAHTLRAERRIAGVYIFLRPGDLMDLKDRLLRRGVDPLDAARRILRMEEEMAHASEYDTIVENREGHLAEAVAEVRRRILESRFFGSSPAPAEGVY
ncbi:MAG: guanylate kinase [Planctomycetes bacterium]|nr:guanylate kinase [Planctomycetota bacterium]